MQLCRMTAVSTYPSRNHFTIGECASLSRLISEDDILRMAAITGDYNPVHLDEEYAKTPVLVPASFRGSSPPA